MKGGGTLDARTVDDALDLLLAKGMADKAGEEEDEVPEEDVFEAPWEEDDGATGRKKAPPAAAAGDGQNGEVPAEVPPIWAARFGQSKEVPLTDMKELWRGIINPKFNNVDRVWSAADKIRLPQPPHVDKYMDPRQLWLRLPQIAINGMTNCGKSSLLNHLLRWSYASKASSVPGRTDSLNFYCINNRFVLVDFPGYPNFGEQAHLGVAKEWDARWKAAVDKYLRMCAKGAFDLRLVLQLQVTNDPPSEQCVTFSHKFQSMGLPMMLVMTKDDRLKGDHEERARLARLLKKELDFSGPHLHYTTKHELPNNRKARKQLQRWIRTGVEARDGAEVRETMHRVWSGRTGEVTDGVEAAGKATEKAVAVAGEL